MSNLDNILDKLNVEAKEKIEEINREYEEKKNSEIEAIEKNYKEKSQRLDSNFSREKESIVEKIRLSTETKIRDEKIQKLQEVTDRVLELAARELNSISNEKYVKNIREALKASGLEEPEVIVEKNRFSFCNNASLGNVLEDEFVENGFLLRDGKINYDFRTEQLISSIRLDVQPKILKELNLR